MKIKKITIENNKILWNLHLDFTKADWSIFDTVIFVWENWSWKSTLLNIIYEFSNFTIINNAEDIEKRTFHVEFSDLEMAVLASYKDKAWLVWVTLLKEFTFSYDCSIKGAWEQIKIQNTNYTSEISHGLFNNQPETKAILKSIFSDVSINFDPKNIDNVRNSDTDEDIKVSRKSTENISTEITQMLVDIYNKDSWDLSDWVVNNPWVAPPEEQIQIRTKRFKKAFSKMFGSNLTYLWANGLNPVFQKWESNIEINNLSSWEKQIVFRWSYLLKDKESIKWTLALIDEPEISLHPLWQQHVLWYYQELFTNEQWEQTSQIFVTTHSPYVLQWYSPRLGLFIFPGGTRIDNLRAYIWDTPSLWVVSYSAFNLPSIEFHDELYWYICNKIKAKEQKEIDDFLNYDNTKKIKEWKNEKDKKYLVTIQTFIRNRVHHPEVIQETDYNQIEFKESIAEMIKLINDKSL